MLIKNANLYFQPTATLPNAYILLGKTPFQTDIFSKKIIKTFQEHYENTEIIRIDINSEGDWEKVLQEAATYSLFSTRRLLSVNYDKKTLDATGKKSLDTYIAKAYTDSLLLLKAPNLSVKLVEPFAKKDTVQVIQAIEPTASVVHKWIEDYLRLKNRSFDPGLPALIHQHYDGNLLALSQCLEIIALVVETATFLDHHAIKPFLVNQCEYIVYDLPKTCFENNPTKAIQILRQAKNQKQEFSLLLWTITEAIRTLIKLERLVANNQPLTSLKLWSSQLLLYRNALKRYKLPLLKKYLHFAATIDKQIKTATDETITFQSIERLVLALCQGTPV